MRSICAIVVRPVSAIAAFELAAQDLDDVLDSRAAVHREAVEIGAPDQDRAGAARQRLEHVTAAPNAAIHEHGNAPGHAIRHTGQRVDRRRHAVERAPAMIGHDDGVGAGTHRLFRVVGMQDALQDDWQLRDRAKPFEVLPGERSAPNRDRLTWPRPGARFGTCGSGRVRSVSDCRLDRSRAYITG